LSRVFDDPEAPRELVEYVMYHEMLHLVHPPEHRRSRRDVHTRAFREAERRFPDLKGVKGRLKAFLASAENTSGSSMTGA
jgi:predicted metal-dependent hydrolase